MIKPSVLDAMVEAGLTAEQMAAVVKALIDAEEDTRSARREADAERQRRRRERIKMSRDVTYVTRDKRDVTDVTRDKCDTPSPKESFPHTPFKEITPSPVASEANASSAVCPEPEIRPAGDEDRGAIIAELPCISGELFPVHEADVAEWIEAFPAVDVCQQLAAMKAWLNANPKNRKTWKGMKRFVVSWLSREQNRAPARIFARNASPPSPRRMNAVEAYLSMKTEERERHEPTSRTIDHSNAEQLSSDKPRLSLVVGQLGAALRSPVGPGDYRGR